MECMLDRWPKEVMQQLQEAVEAANASSAAGRTLLHVLDNAGHWLHVDNPIGLLELMLPSFSLQ